MAANRSVRDKQPYEGRANSSVHIFFAKYSYLPVDYSYPRYLAPCQALLSFKGMVNMTIIFGVNICGFLKDFAPVGYISLGKS